MKRKLKSKKATRKLSPKTPDSFATPSDALDLFASGPTAFKSDKGDGRKGDGQAAKAKEADALKELLNKGKQKGFVTMDEVNDVLSDEAVSSEHIDEVLDLFYRSDVDIVDRPSASQLNLKRLRHEGEEEAVGRS